MSAPTYSAHGIVLKKTKLGESDLIITMVARDGSQLRLVAKGARKPKGKFSSQLELYNGVDVLCVKGKSLDIVKECRITFINEKLHTDPLYSTAASCIAELTERMTQPDLSSERIYGLVEKSLRTLPSEDPPLVPLLLCAFLLKAFAFSGFKPNLDACTRCDGPVVLSTEDACSHRVSFSYIEGGVVCDSCRASTETISIEDRLIGWLRVLLMCKLEDIGKMECDERTAFELLSFCQQWCIVHVGRPLRSLSFFMTAEL